jgi:hypothetical protein
MLGMFLTADSPTVLVPDGSFVSTGSALAVTVVDSYSLELHFEFDL